MAHQRTRIEYTKKTRTLAAVAFWLHNTGTRNLSNARLELRFPQHEGLAVVTAWDFPRKPRNRLSLPPTFMALEGIIPDASQLGNEWLVSVKFGTVQPKAELTCERPLYFRSVKPIELTCAARILADDLANPIEKVLTLKIDAKSRPIIDRDWIEASKGSKK